MENVALFNKTHKVNKKLCFYYKKTQTLCEELFEEEKWWKKKANQACEDQE